MKLFKGKNSRLILLLVFLLVSSFYLYFSWNKYQQILATESLQLAKSLAVVLPTGHITNLPQGNSGPILKSW